MARRLRRHGTPADNPDLMANVALLAVTLGAALGPAAPSIFADGPGSTVDDQAQAWHRELERDGDYAETWLVVAQPGAGGLLIATFFVTNLGLRTFDGGYDLTWYGADGRPVSGHREVHRAEIAGAARGLDLRLGAARLVGDERGVSVELADPDMSLSLRLAPRLPPVQHGDGRIALDDGKVLHHGFQVPRAAVSGTLRAGAATVTLDGEGFADHLWATVKLPSLLERFQTLRVLDPRFTLVLYEQVLARRYGGATVRFGLLGKDGTVLAPLRDFTYTVARTRREPVSGLELPTEIVVDAAGGGWRVRGSVVESRFLEAADMLGRLSWPVRSAIAIFYARPFSLRYLGHYRLEVTDPDGSTTTIEGDAPLECNHY